MCAQPVSTSGPLAGVRVLDLTAVVLGPMATQILGDYGADVIKLEAPEGDRMRANGVTRRPRGMSSIFLAINRNKRSLCIDLKQSDGVAAIKRLLPTVDVLVHNMRLAAKHNFDDGHERNARIREIYDDMASVTCQMSSVQCLALCESLDIAATRIHTIDELPEHPHLKAVGLFQRGEHPSEGSIIAVRPPTKFARTPATLRLPAPLLGQHTDEVLREAGYDDAQITALKATKVVFSRPLPEHQTPPGQQTSR